MVLLFIFIFCCFKIFRVLFLILLLFWAVVWWDRSIRSSILSTKPPIIFFIWQMMRFSKRWADGVTDNSKAFYNIIDFFTCISVFKIIWSIKFHSLIPRYVLFIYFTKYLCFPTVLFIHLKKTSLILFNISW